MLAGKIGIAYILAARMHSLVESRTPGTSWGVLYSLILSGCLFDGI